MYVFAAPPTPSVPIAGRAERFPVHRIYCIGRNYAEHAKEMGAVPEKGTPVFFMKPADAVVTDGRDPRFPPATSNLHFEVEMVAALHSGGRDIAVADALTHVYGYAVGVDLTRRDLQAAAKAKGNPWDTAKGFDDSAPVSPLVPADGRHPVAVRLRLAVNGDPKQDTSVADMLWPLPEIIAELSKLYELQAGDLIFTGTPAGVGPLQPSDRVQCSLDGWATLEFGFSA
ncbi:MAG: fumarylacetoacetate hydrolase family protein [Rhodanobacteraceae bacterium]|nr:fumarylacetoacetate hydrolase family protein [Rhodanobacteraceae bacterium]